MASKDLQELIDREIEKIERHRKKLDALNAPAAITGEFTSALASAKKARAQKGDTAIHLLAEARFLHARARECGLQWVDILDKIKKTLK